MLIFSEIFFMPGKVSNQIISPSHYLWEGCKDIYMNSFPEDERREMIELEKINDTGGYFFEAILNNDALCGIIETWVFPDFFFIEHLAIIPEMQNKGLGRSVLTSFLSGKNKPVVLEAEVPSDTISEKRIKFYNTAGFRVLDVDYTQPPYYPGKKCVPMLLLSDREISTRKVEKIIEQIRLVVYKVSIPAI